MQKLVNRFIEDESGATAIEYGLTLGRNISTKFTQAATSVGAARENKGG